MADDAAQPKADADSPQTPQYWVKEFAAAKKWFSKFHSLARNVEKSFLMEGKQDIEAEESNSYVAKYALFWSNVQVLLAAMYGRMPKVEVDRTNLDPGDDIARVGAIILERIFNSEFHNIDDSPYYIYQEAIQDRFVAGMGVAWARYTFQKGMKTLAAPTIPGQPQGQPIQIPVITDEQAPIDYVSWDDFMYSPCRRWQERRWQARRLPMCKEEVQEIWGPEKAEAIPYSYKSKSQSNEDPIKAQTEPQAEIWEVWDLYTKTAYWYVPGAEELLDMRPDPLKLAGFWPSKRPLFATMLSRKCLPRPDFKYAQSQYAELNLIVQRCKLLTEALKVVGVYDKQSSDLQNLLQSADMNKMVPVDNWAMFAEKGGLKGIVDWFPLEMVINTLEKLVMRKSTLVQEVYEILGISDIQRGMAATRETATTQRLKAQFGSARSNKTQEEIARFITDHTRLRAEIICKWWQPQTIMQRSQIDKTPDAQYAQQAIRALKSDPSMLLSRITVAADTIAAPDWDLEKQQRVDFLQAISQFMGMVMPLIEKDPTIGPFAVQIIQWASTGFKGAKQIEGVLDQAYQRMVANLQAKAGKPKEPTPEEKLKNAQAEKAAAEARFQNLETALASMGFDATQLMSLAIIPPAEQVPQQPQGMPPQGQPGMAPQGQPGMAPQEGGGAAPQTPGAPPAAIPPSVPTPTPQG